MSSFRPPFTLKTAMLCGAGMLFGLVAIAAFVSPGGAWPLCVAGIALLVLAHFDQIAEISASATGARIVLQQVKDRVGDLQRLMKLSARMNLALGQRMGRWGDAFTLDEQEAIRIESEQLMRDGGVSEEEIKQLRLVEWDRYVRLDYIFWICRGVTLLEEARADWDRIRKVASPGSPSEVEAYLVKNGALDEDRTKLLDLYRYYYEHGEHRDREAWRDRNKADE